MCSMSFTVVVSARSNGGIMRPAISSGGNPWYCQATPTMGILMLGNMSTGMRTADSVPMMRMSKATTINVYGRLSAIRTIASMRAPRSGFDRYTGSLDHLTLRVQARCLVEEPYATLGLVDPVLDQALRRNVTVLVTDSVCASQPNRQL